MLDPKGLLPLPPPSPPIPRALADSLLPATAKQCRYIALLCMRLKIREPLEEQVRTRGEAGRLIRELKERLKWQTGTIHVERRKYGKSNFIDG